MEQNRNNKIDEILNSLEGIQKATLRPYFFTRLEARMQREKNRWYLISSFLTRPAIAMATICMIVALNGYAIARYFEQQDMASTTTEIQNGDDNVLVSSNLVSLENFAP